MNWTATRLALVAQSTFPGAEVSAVSVLVELFVLPLGTRSDTIGHDWMPSDASGGRGTGTGAHLWQSTKFRVFVELKDRRARRMFLGPVKIFCKNS
jgi:hypothetical protein